LTVGRIVSVWRKILLRRRFLQSQYIHRGTLLLTWNIPLSRLPSVLGGPLAAVFRELSCWAIHTPVKARGKDTSQNCWVFGFCPPSGIVKTRKHNVSGIGSVSVFRWGAKAPTLLGPLERANVNHWGKAPILLGPLERANANHWGEAYSVGSPRKS
jgi:hypothetical protein